MELLVAEILVEFGKTQGGNSYETGYQGLQALFALKDLDAAGDRISPKVRDFLRPEFEKVRKIRVRD